MPTLNLSWQRRSFALLIALAMLGGTAAIAQSYDPDQDVPHPTLWQKRIEKLGRGLSNVLFGWSEIPLAWHRGVQQKRPLTQILTHGTVVGTSRFFVRTGVGIYEVFGFYTANPNGKYEPMVEPEYLF